MAASTIVEVPWLLERLGDPEIAVVDCRFRLGDLAAGRQLYEAGHVPGARFLDLDRDLAGAPGAGGRHPLPNADDFQQAAARAGIGSNTQVVAYDEAGEGGAARLWWLLRHFGHDSVGVLNGGLRAWREAGGTLRAEAEPDGSGDFVARPRSGDTVTAEELGERLERGDLVLLDARAPERFRGDHEPIDPVAGHVPGAHNLPSSVLLDEGRLKEPEELRVRFAEAGADHCDVVASCGSGITACNLLLAAAVAGLPEPRLYPGSWSEWSSRGLPVARGDQSD